MHIETGKNQARLTCHGILLCAAVLCGAAIALSGCASRRGGGSWDNIDYQRTARSRVYQDNDSYYQLPSVATCNGPDDDVVNPNCR